MERARRVEQLMGMEAGATTDASRPGLSMRSALGAVGTRRVFRTKVRSRRHSVARHRQHLRVRARLERKGWTGAAIDRVLKAIGRSG